MSVPQALFPDGSLDAYAQLIPSGKTVANPSHVVQLTLSTGETVVIGTVATLMRLFTYMAQNQIWHLMPTEDIIIAAAGCCKLCIMEANFQNQRILAGFCPVYQQGQLGWMQRGTAAILSTDEALQSVGHYRLQTTPYTGTWEMSLPAGNANPRMLVVDYSYSMTAVNAAGTTLFKDSPPLTFTTAGSTFTGPGS
jgi:hypothetical protein